jgi:hypothetical protein
MEQNIRYPDLDAAYSARACPFTQALGCHFLPQHISRQPTMSTSAHSGLRDGRFGHTPFGCNVSTVYYAECHGGRCWHAGCRYLGLGNAPTMALD